MHSLKSNRSKLELMNNVPAYSMFTYVSSLFIHPTSVNQNSLNFPT